MKYTNRKNVKKRLKTNLTLCVRNSSVSLFLCLTISREIVFGCTITNYVHVYLPITTTSWLPLYC